MSDPCHLYHIIDGDHGCDHINIIIMALPMITDIWLLATAAETNKNRQFVVIKQADFH